MISRMVERERQTAMAASGHHEPESPDLGELLRLVVIRNNRLQRLIALDAPEIMVRNERRMLRAAMNAVSDHGAVVDMARDATDVSADHVNRVAAENRRANAPANRREATRLEPRNKRLLETGE